MANVLMLLDKEFPADDRVEKEAFSLIKHGHRVTMLCPGFINKPKQEIYKEINIHRISIKKNLFNKFVGLIQLLPLYKFLWLGRARSIIEREDISIVHFHDLPLCCLIKPLRKNSALKFVADMHENYPAMVAGQEHMKKVPNKYLISIKKWYVLEQKWLQQADLIICTASGMISRLKHQLKGNHQFVLVPNTLDIEEFESSQRRSMEIEEKNKTGFNILSYGVVSEQRGIQFVVEALSKIISKMPDARLIILGDGSYLKVLKEKVKRLDLETHVLFEGWQSQEKLISYMENTQITIIPHVKSEHTDNTSPNKLFHFMYFKKPVIASNCNYIQEIVEAEKCGIVYTFDDIDELAAAIERLYFHEKERMEMGQHGYNALLRKYNWQTTIAPMIEMYQSLS